MTSETPAKSPLAGGCQCGALRYEIPAAEILTLYCCHCRECQRQASSGFGMSMWLPRGAFRLTQGKLANWQRGTDSGNINRARFCPDCGVRIYHDAGAESPTISLKAGSLDDTAWLRPFGHIWVSRAQPWVRLDKSLLIYDREPESFGDLIAAYQAAD